MRQPMYDRYSDFAELGPTDEAFKRASWQFHGSLEDALTELVRDEAIVK